jgi:AraC family transcriptional regulator of arabinose operon
VVLTLLAGHETRASTWCWRPRGTTTPLLVHTRAGSGRVETEEHGEHRLSPGDTVVWLPGAPHDFGCAPDEGPWEIVWMHVVQRTTWPAWTTWPELAPGLRWVPSPDDAMRGRIEQALLDTVAAHATSIPHSLALSMNALERALIWLDAATPGKDQLDGRVHDALDLIARQLDRSLDVGTIAAAVNLSPSRLAHMFTEQVGTPPARYVEMRRLERAQHLLSSTSMTVGAIARACGFSSQFYFATRFRRHTGSDPTSWRSADGASDHG